MPASAKEIEAVFNLFDKEGEGAVKITELAQILRCLGKNPTEAEARDLGKSLKKDTFTLSDLNTLYNKKLRTDAQTQDVVLDAFKSLDKKKSGMLPAAELKEVLGSVGLEALPRTELEKFMELANPDKQGLVDYHALTKALFAK
eukprot:TRINITY_DN15689_c0_g1_i1.p1 TRINITY_DN15689_c0_g1~~TRINITY_DN15689_c0_g1_i1.p1  ORF type:complete len:160 (+),score=59.79 TRINITY_DN15689_c0_g1_i1:51-482(+)